MTLYQTELRSLPLETSKKIANPRPTARPKIERVIAFLKTLCKNLQDVPEKATDALRRCVDDDARPLHDPTTRHPVLIRKIGSLAVARKAKESADGGTRTHTDFSTGS